MASLELLNVIMHEFDPNNYDYSGRKRIVPSTQDVICKMLMLKWDGDFQSAPPVNIRGDFLSF